MHIDPMFAESLIEEGGEGIRILFDDLGRVDSSARLETLAALYCALSASDNVLNCTFLSPGQFEINLP